MEISRKDFLKGAAGATGLLLVQSPAMAMAKEPQNSQDMAMLIDVTRCVNCWWCYAACKSYNRLPETGKPDLARPPELSADVWTTLHPVNRGIDWVSRKKACNHCTEAACVEVCPTGALSYNRMGYVQYDKEKCSGCGYCAEFCPYGVPQMESDTATGVAIMNKCTFCHDRVTGGEKPACAAACTTGAITYGKRAELMAQARERVASQRQNGTGASLYGADELGGLHVMYVLDDSPEVYGLPADPEVPPAATVRNVFGWVGIGAAVAAIIGFVFNYIISREAKMVSDLPGAEYMRKKKD